MGRHSEAPAPRAAKRPRREARGEAAESTEPQSGRELRSVARYLSSVKFKHQLFGVSELDVWRKINELNELYKIALQAERLRYEEQLQALRNGQPGEDRP